MTNLGSSAAALAADRNTWHSRADSAWGSSRVWNSGTSWESGYNTEFANARDTSGGAHPTGWVSSQLWSTTASQWNTMYTTEFNNARDTSTGTHPTGWVTSQLWSTTASQWQTMYNSEVTLYNNALAPAAVDHLSGSGAPGAGDTWTNIVNLTADRTGQWVVVARMDEPSGGAYGGIELFIGGVSQGRLANTFSGSPVYTDSPKMGFLWQGSATSGVTVFRLDMMRWGNSSFTGYLDAYFIPTSANPH